MGAHLSSITGRESRANPRPNITKPSFFVRLSAPADIRRPKLRASRCTNTHGTGCPYHAPSKPARCELIISRLLLSSPRFPIPGSGKKLPHSGHQYGFPAKRVFVEQQEERPKVLRLVNQEQEAQEAELSTEPEPLPCSQHLLDMSHNYRSYLGVVRRSEM